MTKNRKQEIRTEVKRRRADADPRLLHEASKRAVQQFTELDAYKDTQILLAYVDAKREVETRLLMRQAWEDGKRVAAPRVDGSGIMHYYYIDSLQDLEPGSFGIMEPKKECPLCETEDGLLLMPGVAFDEHCHRVGYGGGYYDRYLEKHPGLVHIALAFEFQIFAGVPFEEHDILPQMIVTDLRILIPEEKKMKTLEEIGVCAREAEPVLRIMDTSKKNETLLHVAETLMSMSGYILAENAKDVARAKENGMNQGLIDRLMLNESRMEGIAEGIRQVAALNDPVGEVLSMKQRPNGLMIGQKRVPLGVIGIIYESRPNVTADAFALCFKAGNVVILRGGSDAFYSNLAIVKAIRTALGHMSIPQDAIQLIEDTRRETVQEFMKMNRYVDVLIPRGGAGLIRTVVENSRIPVIETGTGNCHIFVDESADFDMAADIIFNAKTQRIGVCNACESLVVHEKIVDAFLPVLKKRLDEMQVEMRGDDRALQAAEGLVPAEEGDWGREYLDYILSVKTVSGIDEAIRHINRYNTGHSEAIVTSDYANAQRFLNEIDAAAVYVNASTRFTDGFEFGFGAEIGISTQKLHARGPMGLEALTSSKYIIYGNGQIR
ncbi:MAG: glutamate-5-semialdehyde dehydrogenase [Clostridiales bacterium]|nr:glutamate-5-semialdehyde dehydrogenase [Clostridiales bacterium]